MSDRASRIHGAIGRRAAILSVARVVAGIATAGLPGCGRSDAGSGAGSRRATAGGGARLLTARRSEIELGRGLRATAWTYDGQLPGPELRVREGERVRVRLQNSLPAESSIHWHGIPQRGTNAMDGVPGVTQRAVAPGGAFDYDFVAEPPGTFFFHSHFGLQLERGLYAPLIVEAAREPLAYDREYVLVFDDWPSRDPEALLADLLAGRGMADMADMTAMTKPMPGMETGTPPATGTPRGTGATAAMAAPGRLPADTPAVPRVTAADAGPAVETGADIAYTTFLVNGRAGSDPPSFEVRRGERVRLRLINAGAATGFRVAVGGHRLRVTHADAIPVEPVDVDALELGVGERYDVLLLADAPGMWPLVAMSVDEPSRGARALIVYTDAGASRPPAPDARPRELDGRLLRYADLVSADGGPLGPARWVARPDRVIDVPLLGRMQPYRWSIGDDPAPAPPFLIAPGETVLVRMENRTLMRHPMHIHGHSFRLWTGAARGPVWKDTATVNPGEALEFQFTADNPGAWLLHCHHAYHQDAGMMRVVRYLPPSAR